MKLYNKIPAKDRKEYEYEWKKVKEDQINFTRKVFGIFTSMLVFTMCPVLLNAFDKFPVTPDDNSGIWIALSIAILTIMLLACTYFPCNARLSQRKYVHRIVPINFFLLYTFSGAVSYLLIRLVDKL